MELPFTDVCSLNSQDMELIDMNLPLLMINYIASELHFCVALSSYADHQQWI